MDVVSIRAGMRTAVSMTAALLLAVLLGGCSEGPEGQLTYADGTAARPSGWHGRYVLINYWAEWCAPCRREIPELNELAEERADELLVVGVNFDGLEGATLREVSASMGIEFPVLASDPRQRWGYERPTVLPTTVIVDREGKLGEILHGPQTRESLERALGLTETL